MRQRVKKKEEKIFYKYTYGFVIDRSRDVQLYYACVMRVSDTFA